MKKNSIEYVLGMRTFGYNEKLLKEANDLIGSIHGCSAIEFWDWFFNEYERNDIADFFEGSGYNIDYLVYKYLVWRLSVSIYAKDEILENIIDLAGYGVDIKDGKPFIDYDIEKDKDLSLMLANEFALKIGESSNHDLLTAYLCKKKIKASQNLVWLLKEIKFISDEDKIIEKYK